MVDFKRRDVLIGGVAAGVALGTGGIIPARAAPTWNNTPEKGASIRVLRWKQLEFCDFVD